MAVNQTEKERYRTNTQDLEWKKERAEFDDRGENIGDIQRMLSAMAGIVFLAFGLFRRNWSGRVAVTLGGGLLYRAVSGYCPALGAMGIDMSGNNQAGGLRDTSRLGRRKVHTGRATKIQRSIEINRPAHELYRVWRSLENLPRIMNHLDSVQVVNDRLSHWVVKTMSGAPKVEWDAEIINDVENERIGWRSLQGANVNNTGSVEFKPIGDGNRTCLTVTLQYESPGGELGAAMVKWFGEDPNTKIAEDLQRFKEQVETGAFSQAEHQHAKGQ